MIDNAHQIAEEQLEEAGLSGGGGGAPIDTLPTLPVIYARDMYAAQGVRLTADDRAALTARADFARRWGLPTGITLRVLSPAGAHIGGMTYSNF